MVPSFPCMSFLSLPIFSWLLWDGIYIQLIGFVLNDFTQTENRLLVLCQSGHVVEVPCPDLNTPESTKTFRLFDLPSRVFRFRSIKSQIKVWPLVYCWEFFFFHSLLCTERMSVVLVKARYYHNFRPFVLLKYLRETWKLQDDKLSRSRKRKRKKRVGKNQASWSPSRRRRRRSYLPFTFHRNRVHSSVGFTHSLTSSGSPW